MANEINVSQLCEVIKNAYELYQSLETSNDVDEDNPAFDFVCDVTEVIFNICMDLMSIVAEHPDADKDLVREYKQILSDIREVYEDFSDDDDFDIDLPKFY